MGLHCRVDARGPAWRTQLTSRPASGICIESCENEVKHAADTQNVSSGKRFRRISHKGATVHVDDVPVAQSTQTVLPAVGCARPAKQGVHSAASLFWSRNHPGSHKRHVRAPTSGMNSPKGQTVHWLCASSGCARPTGHDKQILLWKEGWYVPESHCEH